MMETISMEERQYNTWLDFELEWNFNSNDIFEPVDIIENVTNGRN